MKKRSFTSRLNNAVEGLIRVFKEHRIVRLHLLVGSLVFATGVFLGLGRIELLFLAMAIGLVLFAEIVNSCLETVLDFVHPDYNPILGKTKDMLAGAVLFMGLIAFFVIYLLFIPYLEASLPNGFQRLKGANWYITFLTLSIVGAIVIISKTFFQKGTPMRGGIPSGHAAMSFSIWTIVTLLEANALISILIFIMAVMIAASRLKEGIHTIWEIILGALAGFLVTLTIFQIFTV
ncbi:MAG: diacylglycerol kinase [Candidatus Omnitrophica bacterium]|nr:diacylglycerol kinase [Candidatus Omnitrophota bacterium]